MSGLLRDEAGGVTIDWVAVTAGILLLGIMVVYAIFNGGVSSLSSNISSTLAGAPIGFGPAADLNNGATDAERTGNASDQACVRSGRFVVCMGPL